MAPAGGAGGRRRCYVPAWTPVQSSRSHQASKGSREPDAMWRGFSAAGLTAAVAPTGESRVGVDVGRQPHPRLVLIHCQLVQLQGQGRGSSRGKGRASAATAQQGSWCAPLLLQPLIWGHPGRRQAEAGTSAAGCASAHLRHVRQGLDAARHGLDEGRQRPQVPVCIHSLRLWGGSTAAEAGTQDLWILPAAVAQPPHRLPSAAEGGIIQTALWPPTV